MIPKNPLDLRSAAGIDKLVAGNKAARRAVRKATRKLRAARRAKNVTEIRLLLGMATVALDKATVIARTALPASAAKKKGN